LITDRFGKIGSQPKLEPTNLNRQIDLIVQYMKKRAGGQVGFEYAPDKMDLIEAQISPPLFDWVMENLLKNALDAMDGKGLITVALQANNHEIVIDVTDTGKGIAAQHLKKVFKPGFTTKKRGWGLGLSLSKRIVEQYHKGKLFVRWSEPGKGTNFRIILPLAPRDFPG
jgi:signal transduction histidine kinase